MILCTVSLLVSFRVFAADDSIPISDFVWPVFEEVAVNSTLMTHITHAGDGSGRLFVVEQRGQIRILAGGQLATTPFLDIIDKVASGGERGLLSVAFAKDFATSGEFYVNYTRPTNPPPQSNFTFPIASTPITFPDGSAP